jgi:hypothetical protein
MVGKAQSAGNGSRRHARHTTWGVLRAMTRMAGAGRQPAAGDDTASTERIVLVAVGALRAATVLFAGAHLAAGTPGERTGVEAAAFVVVVTVSLATMTRAALHRQRPLDGWAGCAEMLAGLTGLLLLANATPVADRFGPDFWMLPWTVITAVSLGAACKRAIVGLLGSLLLAGGYLVAVVPAMHPGPGAEVATIVGNAVSYPGFFVLGLVGFRMLRFVSGQAEKLRKLAAQFHAESARVTAAAKAYGIGHDIPKAYLRELRRADKPAADLREWAAKSRDDLMTELSTDPRTPVDLAQELVRVAAVFSSVVQVTTDTRSLASALPGVPIRVIADAVRECLNNASYYSYGSPVTVQAASTRRGLTVSVTDSGPGCYPQRVMAAFALKQNAIHLVEVAGGGYCVESTATTGTTVRLTFPLN